jgi:hypothetical protein
MTTTRLPLVNQLPQRPQCLDSCRVPAAGQVDQAQGQRP